VSLPSSGWKEYMIEIMLAVTTCPLSIEEITVKYEYGDINIYLN
jgi:hypothetical protein